MNTPIPEEVLLHGRKVRFVWISGDDPKPFTPWSQAYGFCFDKEGNLLIIKGDTWNLPGGGREKGESPQQTLRREVLEEANAQLSNIVFLGALEVHDPDNPAPREYEKRDKHFALRFAARIEKLMPLRPDPTNGITYERKFIRPKDFSKYIKWGARGESMVTAAVAAIGQQ